MLLDGRKFEGRNFPRVKQALKAIMLTASGQTFSTLPRLIAKEFDLSTRVSEELFYSSVVGKYDQIHFCFTLKVLAISHIQKVPDGSLRQRGRGPSSGEACRQREIPVGKQPYKISHLFSILNLQGAQPTSYLLAIFNLFWPGLDLLGKCFLCFPKLSNFNIELFTQMDRSQPGTQSRTCLGWSGTGRY